MGVKADPESIRDMEKELKDTVKKLESISQGIYSATGNLGDWNDDKAEEFRIIMKRIADLIVAPVDTLNASAPKLEELALALDRYNNIHFD